MRRPKKTSQSMTANRCKVSEVIREVTFVPKYSLKLCLIGKSILIDRSMCQALTEVIVKILEREML